MDIYNQLLKHADFTWESVKNLNLCCQIERFALQMIRDSLQL